MSNRPFIPRNQGLGEWNQKWDDYRDVADGGLAETDAFSAATNVHKTLNDQGLNVEYYENDSEPVGYTVTWPELMCLAEGMNPSDPDIQVDPGWVMDRDPLSGMVFPWYRATNHKSPVKVFISPQEATEALGGVAAQLQQDPNMVRIYQRIKQVKQYRNQQLAGRR